MGCAEMLTVSWRPQYARCWAEGGHSWLNLCCQTPPTPRRLASRRLRRRDFRPCERNSSSCAIPREWIVMRSADLSCYAPQLFKPMLAGCAVHLDVRLARPLFCGFIFLHLHHMRRVRRRNARLRTERKSQRPGQATLTGPYLDFPRAKRHIPFTRII